MLAVVVAYVHFPRAINGVCNYVPSAEHGKHRPTGADERAHSSPDTKEAV